LDSRKDTSLAFKSGSEVIDLSRFDPCSAKDVV
jgi:hypothetical protein